MIRETGSCAVSRANLPLTSADNRVPGALPGWQDRWHSAGRDRAALHEYCRHRVHHGTAPLCSGTGSSDGLQLIAAEGSRVLYGDRIRSRGLDVFGQVSYIAGESGSMSGRRMLPHSGGRDLDRGAGRCAGRFPDLVDGADCSGQRGPVS